MRLNDEEQAMLAGELGEPRRWAVAHQIAVGEFFDAADFVPVSQAHIMADTESLGEAGVRFLEGLAAAPEAARRVRVPAITDPRGIDFAVYRRLGQTKGMAAFERRAIAVLSAFGVLMTDTCINYQTIMAPLRGEHVAMAIPARSSMPTASLARAAISKVGPRRSPRHSPAARRATAITWARSVAPPGGSSSRSARVISANGVRSAASSARLAPPIGRCR
jgi:Aconitase X